MKDGREFVLNWVINAALFYFVPSILVGMMMTGNARLAPFMASVISGFLLTAMNAAALPAFEFLKIQLKDEWQRLLAFLFVNVLGIWMIARYADLTGVGVSSAWVAVILGIVTTTIQGVVKRIMSSSAKK